MYRNTALGECLCEALEQMIEAGRLSEDSAHAVLSQFDRSIVDSLASVSARGSIKAELKTYKFFDNVWQFDLNNVVCRLSTDNTDITCDRARLICVDQKMMTPADLL